MPSCSPNSLLIADMNYDGNDDFRSMHEVVTRYFARRVAEAKTLPDLVIAPT